VFSPDHPVIAQADGSILLDAHHPRADEARAALAPYAEIVSAPEHVHTYRLSAISVWNALALGRAGSDVKIDVGRFARYGIPANVVTNIDGWVSRYGRIRLEAADPNAAPGDTSAGLRLVFSDAYLAREAASTPKVAGLLAEPDGDCAFHVPAVARGEVKWALIKMGYPVDDVAGYGTAEPLRLRVLDGESFQVRDYQRLAIDAFLPGGVAGAGHGVVVLPCGAGKTLVGLLAIERAAASTLILATSEAAVEQWYRELRERTDLPDDAIGRYTGRTKTVRPVTIATYSVVTARRKGEFTHLALFRARPFGLVIYDEVHLLPAPVFRATASLQAVRRLGLTATLLREDGREDDVFALIGPKRYDVPWKVLERQQFIAAAECGEVQVALDLATRAAYATASPTDRFRIASTSDAKLGAVQALRARHPERPALVLGIYVEQLKALGAALGAPVVTGETPIPARERIYEAFRRGEVPTLVMSRVGSFALDLPNASLAIEVSGTWGSRQEEAQRLGRILRPKDGIALFYTVVSRDTVEVDVAMQRQRFLAEQGYRYRVEAWPPEDRP